MEGILRLRNPLRIFAAFGLAIVLVMATSTQAGAQTGSPSCDRPPTMQLEGTQVWTDQGTGSAYVASQAVFENENDLVSWLLGLQR